MLTPLVGSSSRMISGRSANAEATSRSFLSPWGAGARDVALVGEAEELGDLERGRLHLAVGGERGEERAAAAEPRDDGGLQGLEHGQLGEDVDELEAPRHAEPRRPRPARSRDVAPLEPDRARARPRAPPSAR